MANLNEKATSVGGKSLLVGAILFGVIAALLAFVYLKSREAALIASLKGPEENPVRVVVATQDLTRGTMITKKVFSSRKVPARFVHDDAIKPGDFARYEGQALTASLGRGKTLLKSFVDREFPVDFSDSVGLGRRAMTVQVDEVNSIAGFVRPGNHVDLFVNIPFKTTGFDAKIITSGVIDELPDSVSKILPPALVQALEGGGAIDDATIEELVSSASPTDVIIPVLQNVRVLATGRDPYRENLDRLRYPQQRSERTFSTVTLDVDAKQAALLAAAEDKGDLLALLRNREDQGLADFTGVSAEDLFGNAIEMANQAAEQQSRLATPAGTDTAGNLVDADGNTIMSAKQLADAGYKVNENGEIVDANGNVVDPKDIAVTADGKIVNKAALAAAGYTVNEQGQIVDADGRVVDANDLVISEDGTVLDKTELAAAGLTVNENGEIVDANGRVVNPDELVRTADGTILTKSQLADAGLSVNENGEIVDANGNVIDAENLAEATGGALIKTDSGKVFSKAQLAEAGLSVNENGEIVDANGNVVDPNDLVITEDGQLALTEEAASGSVDLIIGGDSTDGIAKATSLRAAE